VGLLMNNALVERPHDTLALRMERSQTQKLLGL